jgi:hypothetical protein
VFVPSNKINCSIVGYAGPLPASIGELSSLTSLQLSGNQLSGKYIYLLVWVIFLLEVLTENWLMGSNTCLQYGIFRKVDNFIRHVALNMIVTLYFSSVEIVLTLFVCPCWSGEIPASLGDLRNLTDLNLGHNLLRGEMRGRSWRGVGCCGVCA